MGQTDRTGSCLWRQGSRLFPEFPGTDPEAQKNVAVLWRFGHLYLNGRHQTGGDVFDSAPWAWRITEEIWICDCELVTKEHGLRPLTSATPIGKIPFLAKNMIFPWFMTTHSLVFPYPIHSLQSRETPLTKWVIETDVVPSRWVAFAWEIITFPHATSYFSASLCKAL